MFNKTPMQKSILLVSIVSLGLLSANICACSMPLMMAAAPADHCTPSEEGDTPVDQCCFVQVASVASTQLTTPTLEIQAAASWEEIVGTSRIVPRASSGEILQMPPGRKSLTHQICVLLI